MDKQLTPAEVGQILGYKDQETVRRIMRQMIHMEGPLRVTETELQKWINERTYKPVNFYTEAVLEVSAADRIPRRRGGKCG